MTTEEVEDLFEKYEDEYLEYDSIKPERILHKNKTAHLFILLGNLTDDVCGGADHDIIYLPYIGSIAEKATEEDIMDLIRLGVHNSSEYDCLCKFV